MTCNQLQVQPNRHSYVDYSDKPYIYYFGTPINKNNMLYTPQNQNNKNRTIIRTNQINNQRNLNDQRNLNGQRNLNNIGGNLANNWSSLARKDNMFIRYSANNCGSGNVNSQYNQINN